MSSFVSLFDHIVADMFFLQTLSVFHLIFKRLADTFIQCNLQCIQGIHYVRSYIPWVCAIVPCFNTEN